MKRTVRLLCCLLVMMMFVQTASAASYVTIRHLKSILRDVTQKTVLDLDISDDTILVAEYRDSSNSYFAVFDIEGTRDNIVCYLWLGPTLENIDTEKLLLSVNSWNSTRRYPRAYINPENHSVYLDDFLFCTDDVTDAMISEFAEDMFSGTKQFIRFMSDEGYTVFDSIE